MTTIAYRDGVMAADSRAYAGFNAALGRKTKIRALVDGTLLGCSATVPGLGEAVMAWYASGAKPDALPKTDDGKFTLLVAKWNGEVFYAADSFHLSGPIEAPFFAIGSGAAVALGALHAGCSAVAAIEIACKADVWSALPVDTLTHARLVADP